LAWVSKEVVKAARDPRMHSGRQQQRTRRAGFFGSALAPPVGIGCLGHRAQSHWLLAHRWQPNPSTAQEILIEGSAGTPGNREK
jgi:hypothetical protein